MPALAALGVDVSVDSWRPEVTRHALQAGATVINAADGMQTDEMWEVAADFDCPIVVPFLSGPNPREMVHVGGDPVDAIVEFFEARLADADRFGLRAQLHHRSGHGLRAEQLAVGGPLPLPEDRLHATSTRCAAWDLPLYIALPWKDTPQHWELLEIVLERRPSTGEPTTRIVCARWSSRLGLS